MSGAKIIEGLKAALAGDLSRVSIDGQTWVRQTPVEPVAWLEIYRADDGREVEVFHREKREPDFTTIRLVPLYTTAVTPDVLSIIDPWTRGAFTGWTGRTGDSVITLDLAEEHFCDCMQDMLDDLRARLPLPAPPEVKP